MADNQHIHARAGADGPPTIPGETLLLEARGVAKSCAGIPALRDGRLELRPGTVHAPCGGNGAGKSTFLNVVMGLVRRDAGRVMLRGREVNFDSPREALQAGIAIITQELSPIPELTAAENIYLGREPTLMGLIDYAALFDKAEYPEMPWGDGTAKLYDVPWAYVTAENADKYLTAR